MNKLVFIEGNIGSGKSTLAKALGPRLGLPVLDEPVDTELLEAFYKDRVVWAFPFQMAMLHKRWRLQMNAASREPGAIVDRSIWGDMVFARDQARAGNINKLEWKIYCEAVRNMCLVLFPPTLLIFLATSPHTCLERIRKRGRPGEEAINIPYLQRIHDGYQEMLSEAETGFYPWSHAVKPLVITADVTTVDDAHMDRVADTVNGALRGRSLPDYISGSSSPWAACNDRPDHANDRDQRREPPR